VGVANFFWDQSLGIDETNKFHAKIFILASILWAPQFWAVSVENIYSSIKTVDFLSSIKTVGITVLGGLWAFSFGRFVGVIRGKFA